MRWSWHLPYAVLLLRYAQRPIHSCVPSAQMLRKTLIFQRWALPTN